MNTRSLRTRSWGFSHFGFSILDFGLSLNSWMQSKIRNPKSKIPRGVPMIVVMKPGSTAKQVEHVVNLVREMGLKDHVIVGTERTVIAVLGDDRHKDRSRFETVEGVEKVVP